jgi:hypothetical protein
MNERLDALRARIRELEGELVRGAKAGEAGFCHGIHAGKARLTGAVRAEHKRLRVGFGRYLVHSRFLVLATSPMIWLCVVPIALADLIGSLYQAICFPIYGIPRVRRGDYLVFDRHRLDYLNFFEKVNCDYCAYVNGILGYFTEIAARTEQHWCPVKHAGCVRCEHSRYGHFLEFGDAETYRSKVEEIRRSFGDITPPAVPPEAG